MSSRSSDRPNQPGKFLALPPELIYLIFSFLYDGGFPIGTLALPQGPGRTCYMFYEMDLKIRWRCAQSWGCEDAHTYNSLSSKCQYSTELKLLKALKSPEANTLVRCVNVFGLNSNLLISVVLEGVSKLRPHLKRTWCRSSSVPTKVSPVFQV